MSSAFAGETLVANADNVALCGEKKDLMKFVYKELFYLHKSGLCSKVLAFNNDPPKSKLDWTYI